VPLTRCKWRYCPDSTTLSGIVSSIAYYSGKVKLTMCKHHVVRLWREMETCFIHHYEDQLLTLPSMGKEPLEPVGQENGQSPKAT
jgi:hypothetical protein